MRITGFVMLGAVLGFLAGIVLSEIIAIVGVLVFDGAHGWKPVPFATAAIGAGLAGVFAASGRRRESKR